MPCQGPVATMPATKEQLLTGLERMSVVYSVGSIRMDSIRMEIVRCDGQSIEGMNRMKAPLALRLHCPDILTPGLDEGGSILTFVSNKDWIKPAGSTRPPDRPPRSCDSYCVAVVLR